MKKSLTILLSAALCVGIFAGCAPKDSGTTPPADGTTPANTAPVALTGNVNTNGSTSMEKVVGSLAEAFMGENNGVTINYSGTGSGTGVQGVLDGTCDIGLSSRDLKDSETANGAVAHVVALDGVAIIVNPANPIADLTVEQIAQLASGAVTDWSEIGGTAGPVAFIGREPGSGTRGAFEEIVGVTDNCKYQNELTSTGDVMANVASNPNAVGYASLSSINDTVKALTVGGVTPSEETVQDGSYAIQRPFILVTKDGTTLSAAAQAFLDYAMSDTVSELIAKAGAVPPVK